MSDPIRKPVEGEVKVKKPNMSDKIVIRIRQNLKNQESIDNFLNAKYCEKYGTVKENLSEKDLNDIREFRNMPKIYDNEKASFIEKQLHPNLIKNIVKDLEKDLDSKMYATTSGGKRSRKYKKNVKKTKTIKKRKNNKGRKTRRN